MKQIQERLKPLHNSDVAVAAHYNVPDLARQSAFGAKLKALDASSSDDDSKDFVDVVATSMNETTPKLTSKLQNNTKNQLNRISFWMTSLCDHGPWAALPLARAMVPVTKRIRPVSMELKKNKKKENEPAAMANACGPKNDLQEKKMNQERNSNGATKIAKMNEVLCTSFENDTNGTMHQSSVPTIHPSGLIAIDPNVCQGVGRKNQNQGKMNVLMD